MIQRLKHITLDIAESKKKVIKEATKQRYTRLIAKSNNKVKTTWNIIKKGDRKSAFNRTSALLT
jgi:hypothetical protein